MLCGGGRYGELEQEPAAASTTDWDVLKDGYVMKEQQLVHLRWTGRRRTWEEEEEEGEEERDSSSLEDSHSSSDCLYDPEVTIYHS